MLWPSSFVLVLIPSLFCSIMTLTNNRFDLRKDHGFRNPPVFPPFVPFSAKPSLSSTGTCDGDQPQWTLRFRRPPTEVWRISPREYHPIEQHHSSQYVEDKSAVTKDHDIDGEDGLTCHLDPHGGWVGDNLPRRERSFARVDGVIAPGGDGSRPWARGAKRGFGGGIREDVLGPLVVDSGEQPPEGKDEEEGDAEDEEDEWVMSPEWAEHFRNSPSVQRYLQRLSVQASQGKGKSGGIGKKGNTTKNPKGNRKGLTAVAAKIGAAASHEVGTKRVDKKSLAAAALTVGRAVKGEECALSKPADDAKNMELELAKIRARALLYAEEQQDRDLEDAIEST